MEGCAQMRLESDKRIKYRYNAMCNVKVMQAYFVDRDVNL